MDGKRKNLIWCSALAATDNIRKALFSCYNASFGGKYELAGRVEHIDELLQQGFVKAAKCRNDPLSTHGAKSCRVLLVRMTEKGVSEASQVAEGKLEAVGRFLKSLDLLPPRVKGLMRYLIKQWLRACENRMEFAWGVIWSRGYRILVLPQRVRESVLQMRDALIEQGLAAYGALHHKTSGPSDLTLVTCPEIHGWLLNGTGWLLDPDTRASGVRTVVLDEYLRYLLDGLSLVHAKALMLHFFSTVHSGKLPTASLRYLSQEYGVSVESLWSWLEELEGCGDITELNQGAKNAVLTKQAWSPEHDVVAYGDPWHSFADPFGDARRIEDEVKSKIEKWFENGEELFQRFELRR